MAIYLAREPVRKPSGKVGTIDLSRLATMRLCWAVHVNRRYLKLTDASLVGHSSFQ
jgi:hypothetical protein